ncbi:trigger factor [Agriterribacter sp.]|uniref:trigger factor n=1 Tax=Agriterribacter sp. TaxID=2821509 RepID=UPI002B5267D3|nr:trigger factor [Agriterribacter sp.]HRP55491.1 trigger factor [Agriterribacter sp.]
MATVTRENIGVLNDKITVTVSKEDYFPPFEKALKQYAKSANIPGFRKGMVPSGVIKKMHGPAVYTEEVLRSIEKGLVDYLDQEKLDIFAQPLPAADNDPGSLDMNNPAEYSFHFEVGLKPSFELPDLNTIPLKRYKIEVPAEMVDEELERLKVRHGKMTEPETIATDEDVLNVKFEESDAEGNVIENGISKDNSLLLKYFSASFKEQLTGKKKDESVVLQLSSAFDDKERDWLVSDLGLDKNNAADLEKYFKVTITKIGLVEKRELNEEFYEEVYPGKEIKTEEDFRNAIKADIEKALNEQSRNHFHHELYHALLDNTAIEFPESFLKKWMEKGGEQAKTAEQIEEEFPTFKNQLKWTLISDKIVKENQLEVLPDEIRDQITREVLGYFGASGLQGDMSWIDSYVDRLTKDQQQVENAYRKLISEKVFNQIESKATPAEQSISLDDFKKLQEEHQHHHH